MVLYSVSTLTPTFPRQVEAQKMGYQTLLEVDTEEELFRRPFSEQELVHLPALVPESNRFSCCSEECAYVTVDDVMLLYHIEVQHPELESFKCKNCSPALDPISFAGLYRVTHLLANLGWVDLDFDCSTLCLVLPGLLGNWQNWLSSWARWWNIPNLSPPNPGLPGDGSPCTSR